MSASGHQGTTAAEQERREPAARAAAQGVSQALQNVGNESASERPDLTVEQILAWADAHRAVHGAWPEVRLMAGLGPVEGAPGETWKAINFALALDLRGLPGDSSLAELLAEQRGAPPPDLSPRTLGKKLWAWEQEHFPIKKPRLRPAPQPRCPELAIPAILAWADAHHAASGAWPKATSGPVLDAPFHVTWNAIHQALAKGFRGLPAGSSLPRLLAEHRGARNRRALPPLAIEPILAWADAHHAATGAWPLSDFGPVRDAPFDVTWSAIHQALSKGSRGLPGGSSLARLLAEHRGARNRKALPPLAIEPILAWADAHRAATGAWPQTYSGTVRVAPFPVTWAAIHSALFKGARGLPGGSSLPRLLAEHRGARNKGALPPLAIEPILAWADAHRAATGAWPLSDCGPVRDAPFPITWKAIDCALFKGARGLPGGSSLPRLLAEHRGVRCASLLKPLSIEQILAWADAHLAATGAWPTGGSGPVLGSDGESWKAIDTRLFNGGRGLQGGQSLSRVLAEHRGRPRPVACGPLSIAQILSWADAYHAAHGRWPDSGSGRVEHAPGESWLRISVCLRRGRRGLRARTSLAALLIEHRGPNAHNQRPPLSIEPVLDWADRHHAATGRWPTRSSGAVIGAPGEKWANIDSALRAGARGLPGGTTLARLLVQRRGHRNRLHLPVLSPEQILAWADAYHADHGRWPTTTSGPVTGAPGETWKAIDGVLRAGRRGLPAGSSLCRLLATHRQVDHRCTPSRLGRQFHPSA